MISLAEYLVSKGSSSSLSDDGGAVDAEVAAADADAEVEAVNDGLDSILLNFAQLRLKLATKFGGFEWESVFW